VTVRPSSRISNLFLVRQEVAGPVIDDVAGAVADQLRSLDLGPRVRPGQTVAITVGSRGIADVADITRTVVAYLRDVLALNPFIVPAMGSHGGATAEGQIAVLARAGITEATMGCAIRSGMAVTAVATAPLGLGLMVDRIAMEADHLVIVNRIKPHTMYAGPVQSGLAKMLTVGLGNHDGAALYHRAFIEHGFTNVLDEAVPLLLARLPVLAGVAIVERGDDRTAIIEAIPPERIANDEPRLLRLATELLPKLPFADVDILLVDEIGKEISGTGFDTNVVGRKGSLHHPDPKAIARVRHLALRSLTSQSTGNATGYGLAEFVRTQLAEAVDPHATLVNALTSGDLPAAMVPIVLSTDADILDAALALNGLRDPADSRVVWIRNTQHITWAACSGALLSEARERSDLSVHESVTPWPFDAKGNLPAFVTDLL